MIVSRRPNSKGLTGRVGPFGGVVGATAIGQVALAASLPITARLYSAGDIGLFALMLTYCQLASIAVTGRLEQVLPRVRAGDRWVITRLLLILTVIISPMAGLIVAVLSRQNGLAEVIASIALCGSVSLRNLCAFVLLSEERYQSVAFLRLTNGVVTAAAQVIGGLLLPEVWVLILMYVLGDVVASASAIPTMLRVRRKRNANRLRHVAKDQRLVRFGSSVASGAVLSDLGLALPLIGVSIVFGDATAGSFWLARRLLMVPTQLIASSVSEVSYAMIARKSVAEMANLVHGWLWKARLPALLLLVAGLAGAPLVRFVVGEGYPSIGGVMAILTLPSVAQMVATSFANVLLALHMELVRTLWNVLRAAGLFVVFGMVVGLEMGFVAAIAFYAVYMVGAYSLLLVMTLRGIRKRASEAGPAGQEARGRISESRPLQEP